MTTGGFIIFGLSVGTVTLLFIWCMGKVITSPKAKEHLHGMPEKTPDEE